MKVLIYNFKQPENGGGGVGVYSANLAGALHAAGHHVITMDSGDHYSFLRQSPIRLRTWFDKYDRASVANSPMIAPFCCTWDDFAPYTNDRGLTSVPDLLRQKFGDIDVFHFQNVEGLTKDFFLSVRNTFPDARLIYSAHNYSAICPQVDLWFQEREVCVDYRDGRNCTKCFSPRDSSALQRGARRRRPVVTFVNEHFPGLVKVRRSVSRAIKGSTTAVEAATELNAADGETHPNTSSAIDNDGPVYSFPKRDGDGTPYKAFRLANIELCSTTFDTVLAVSKRTSQVLLERGIPPRNLHVSYIGTAHKAIFLNATKITDIGAQLHIAYLGYMRSSKGFYLFLRALEQMPDHIAQTLAVTVAARKTEDLLAYERLVKMSHRFATFRYFDGFTHKTLDTVLQGVNLGIVPPIWEDNLPQVAIEMVSRGVPVLTSDRGGAQEIADNPDFIFDGSSADALQKRITAFSTCEFSLAGFWDRPIQIFSMEEHVEDLLKYYSPSFRQDRAIIAPGAAAEETTLS